MNTGPDLESPENKTDSPLAKIVKTSLIFLGLWLLYFILISCLYGMPKSVTEFGEMFGGLEALFSGIALAGVIIAILLQNEELGLQRQELANTRAELKSQALSLEKTAEIQHVTSEIMGKTAQAQERIADINSVTIMPLFDTKLQSLNQINLEVINISNYFGIDIEILVCLVPRGIESNPKTYLFRYSYFPSKQGVRKVLHDAPNSIETGYLFIQFKSALGSNHHRLFRYLPKRAEDGRFRIAEATPDHSKPFPRVRFSSKTSHSQHIWMDNTETIPEHLKGLSQTLARIPGLVIESFDDVKDTGTWFNYPSTNH